LFKPLKPSRIALRGDRLDLCLGVLMDWRHRAACLDEDPELFFPIGNTGPALLQIEDAKAVCRRCPVVDTCLKWALESGQDAGVWGGLSEDERRALKRRTARQRRAS
jgi:WhiB family transcriptional regulator, redox-sensing transcriptional regulator